MNKCLCVICAAVAFLFFISCDQKQTEAEMVVEKIDSLTRIMEGVNTMSEYIEVGRKGMSMIDEASSGTVALNEDEEKKMQESAEKFKLASSKAYERLGFTEEAITNSIDETTKQNTKTHNAEENGDENIE